MALLLAPPLPPAGQTHQEGPWPSRGRLCPPPAEVTPDGDHRRTPLPQPNRHTHGRGDTVLSGSRLHGQSRQRKGDEGPACRRGAPRPLRSVHAAGSRGPFILRRPVCPSQGREEGGPERCRKKVAHPGWDTRFQIQRGTSARENRKWRCRRAGGASERGREGGEAGPLSGKDLHP